MFPHLIAQWKPPTARAEGSSEDSCFLQGRIPYREDMDQRQLARALLLSAVLVLATAVLATIVACVTRQLWCSIFSAVLSGFFSAAYVLWRWLSKNRDTRQQ